MRSIDNPNLNRFRHHQGGGYHHKPSRAWATCGRKNRTARKKYTTKQGRMESHGSKGSNQEFNSSDDELLIRIAAAVVGEDREETNDSSFGSSGDHSIATTLQRLVNELRLAPEGSDDTSGAVSSNDLELNLQEVNQEIQRALAEEMDDQSLLEEGRAISAVQNDVRNEERCGCLEDCILNCGGNVIEWISIGGHCLMQCWIYCLTCITNIE